MIDLITEVRQHSRSAHGSRRVHAELRLGRGFEVGHGAVQTLMRRAGSAGVSGHRGRCETKPEEVAADLVERELTRAGPDQLWITDISERRAREGTVYCGYPERAFTGRRRRAGDTSSTSHVVNLLSAGRTTAAQ